MKNVYRRSIRVSLGLITAALPLAVQAQDSDEEVFELSPFSVDAQGDIGYRATSTLAGTRLNTQLKDLGAAISVLTDELFDDTGAVDAATILSYATSSEVGGVQGNFAGSGDFFQRADTSAIRITPQGNQRVRGLASASLTRNYFLTDIPFDSYNSTRVTMSRGPNSLLFGIGSPGGVINNGIQGAILGRDFGEVSVRIGEHSSHRETFDYNKELIEGRLALRLSGLHKDTQYQQRPAFDIDKRLSVAAEAVLLRNEESNFLGRTTLQGNYESGSIDGTPPNVIPPANAMRDWFSTPDPSLAEIAGATNPAWVTDGSFVPKFTIDNLAANYTRANFPGSIIEPHFIQSALIYNQPNAQTATIGLSDSSIQGTMGRIMFPRATTGPNVGRNQINIHKTRSFIGGDFTPGFVVPSINDRNVFDNENHLLAGTTNQVSRDFDARNITLEQILLDGDAGIEFAYDQQHYDVESQLPFNQGRNGGGAGNTDVGIDVSEFLANEEPNPNVGRPYILHSPSNFNTSETDREAFRATGFYSIDFSEKSDNLGWLGKHIFSGVYNEQTIDNLDNTFTNSWISDKSDIRANHNNSRINRFFRDVIQMVYIGEPQFGAQSWNDIRLVDSISVPLPKDGDIHNIMHYDEASGLVTTSDDFTVWNTLNTGNIDRQDVESEIFSWQSYLFDGNLVGLAGWRKDTSTVFSRVSNNRLPNGIYDENNLVLTESPASEESGNTFTWSLVGHVPFKLPGGAELSVHYGESENFDPVGVKRDSANQILPPPNGTTKEYGFTLAMLQNKLTAKFNWFETQISGADAGLGGAPATALGTPGRWWLGWGFYNAQGRTIDEALEFAGGPEAVGLYDSYEEFFDVMIRDLVPQEVQAIRNFRLGSDGFMESDGIPGETATTSFVSEGFEFELVGNPTPSWRVFLNIAKQETVQNNTAPALRAFVGAYNDLLAASPIGGWRDDPNNQADFTFQTRFDLRANSPLASALAKDGTLNQELRKWRANLVTTYDFNEGFLKDFFAGGGVRWQDGVATGYPLIANAEGVRVPDVGRPFIGPSEMNGDLWVGYSRELNNKVDWRIQLNARNAFGDSDPITVVTNPDGEAAVMRNPNPKQVFLTNTFSF